jgi:hypothetical protein
VLSHRNSNPVSILWALKHLGGVPPPLSISFALPALDTSLATFSTVLSGALPTLPGPPFTLGHSFLALQERQFLYHQQLAPSKGLPSLEEAVTVKTGSLTEEHNPFS